MELQQINETDHWNRVKTKLREQLGDDAFFNWFGGVVMEEKDGRTVRLSVPTRFLKHWIKSHYEKQLVGLLRSENQEIDGVDLIVRGALRPRRRSAHTPCALEAGSSSAAPNPRRRTNSGLPAFVLPDVIRYPQVPIALGDADEAALMEFLQGAPVHPGNTFASFVGGDSNGLAFEAARRIASANADKLDLVYIHAAVGFGKTHLLHAVANQARDLGQAVCYLTAEYFLYYLVPALKTRSFPTLKSLLSRIDLLLIDDMQFLHGKQARNEFCDTITMLMDPVGKVIVAADRPPQGLDTVETHLRKRLSGGLIAPMQAPDFTLRRGILTKRLKAAQAILPSFDIPAEVLDYIACHVTSCGRDLEGAVNRLLAHHQLTAQAITAYLADKILNDLIRSGEKRTIKIEEIQQVVCKHYNISKADLLSSCRTRNLVRPRQIAMFLSKVLTPRSLPEIGKRFGGRDHTTVLHAVRKIEAQSKTDTDLAQELALLKRLAKG